MVTPRVTEIPRRLEPVTRDPFIDDCSDVRIDDRSFGGATTSTVAGARSASDPIPTEAAR